MNWKNYLKEEYSKDRKSNLKKYGYYKNIRQDYNYKIIDNEVLQKYKNTKNTI